jgi:hypothetical protein
MITIVTLATEAYIPKILPYLRTIRTDSEVRAYIGAVGCDPAPALAAAPHLRGFHVPVGMLANTLGNPGNGCIQHGNFLPYLPGDGDDDVIIVTDGDVRMQRPISDTERGWLEAWPEGLIGIGPNNGPDDTLSSEAARIRPLLPIATLAHRFYPDPERPPLCGNAGVLVARRSTWWAFWAAYLRLWLRTAPEFAHIAVQQWTINLTIERHFSRAVLPLSFHSHGHYGNWMGVEGWGDVVTLEGSPVLFNHRCW